MERLARWTWLLIALPIAALFGPALASDSSFAFRDAGHFYHPLFAWCAREWAAGRVPLWNPGENCGLPVLADATSSVFYPGKLLFALPLDFAFLYKLYIVLHVALAAANSYLLARRWTGSRPAAALAAISYACGGNVVFQYANVVFLVGAAWLPLAALYVEQMLAERNWRAALRLGVVLALMILGGDPQAAYHTLLIAALYAFVLAARVRPTIVSLGRSATLIAVATALAALLAAVQVLPSVEATRHSDRAAFDQPRNIYEAFSVAGERPQALRGLLLAPEAGTHHDLIYDFSVGPWRLIEYVCPNISGRMFPTNRRWMSQIPAAGRVWNPTLYMGLVPLVLALCAVRPFSPAPRIRWLSWIAILFTLGSFGYYGVGWLLQELGFFRPRGDEPGLAPGALGVYWFFVTFLPQYALFRYPAKLLPLVSLALSQLAAQQFDRLTAAPARPPASRALLALGIVSTLAACLAWPLGSWLLGRLTRGDSLTGPFDPRGATIDVFTALMHTALVALLARRLLVRAALWPTERSAWQMALVLLTGLEIAVANHWQIVTAPAELWDSPSPVATRIHASRNRAAIESPSPRVFRGNLATWRTARFARTRSSDRLAELAAWERQTLLPKHHLDQDLCLVESFSSIKSAAYESLLKVAKQYGPQQPDRVLLPQPTLLRLLGAEYLVLPARHQPDFADRLVPSSSDWPATTALWQMRSTLARAWIVHEVATLPPLPEGPSVEELDQRSYEVLFPSGRPRNFASEAVIETLQPPNRSAIPASSTPAMESCAITAYEPQRVKIEATLASPGLLVLSDTYDPNWQATLTQQGREQYAPIYRTNRVLRGVWLPAGQSVVEFRYVPRRFRLGAAVSVLAWLSLAAVPWATRRRGGRRSLKSSNSAPASIRPAPPPESAAAASPSSRSCAARRYASARRSSR